MGKPAVSIIVTCKGRRHHLGRSLPAMLGQRCPFEHEVLVVDFGCPQGTFAWCQGLDCAGLAALRVLDHTAEFNRSRAANCGAAVAAGRLLAFVDADVLLTEGWLAVAAQPILDGAAGLSRVSHDTRGWDRFGTCVVSAEVFHRVRGYEEAFQGWGNEDIDFYRRSARVAEEVKFAPSLLFPIRHGHEERVRFHAEKSIGESERRNQEYQRQRDRVNPHGYGRGAFQVFRGASRAPPAIEWPTRRRFHCGIRYPTAQAVEPCGTGILPVTASAEIHGLEGRATLHPARRLAHEDVRDVEMDEFAHLAAFLLSSMGLTVLIVWPRGGPVAWFRERVLRRVLPATIQGVLDCYVCLGFWCGLAISPIWWHLFGHAWCWFGCLMAPAAFWIFLHGSTFDENDHV